MLLCNHCGKECKNQNSLKNHERLCRENPNRQLSWFEQHAAEAARLRKEFNWGNQWTKAKKTGVPYIIRDDTRKKLSESSIETNKQKWAREGSRERQSEAMKRAVEKYPESYTSSNRGRTKQVIIDGIKFQGAWEVEFYQYCKASNIKIERPNKWFPYEWNGARKYFPDFYLPEKELYVEVKGYETDRDRAKWSAFPKKLRVIKKEDIIKIRQQRFPGL